MDRQPLDVMNRARRARHHQARALVAEILQAGTDHDRKSHAYDGLVSLAQERRPQWNEVVAVDAEMIGYLVDAVHRDGLLEAQLKSMDHAWWSTHREDASELINQTLDTMSRKLGQFGWQGDFTSWIYAILRSRWLDQHRRDSRQIDAVPIDEAPGVGAANRCSSLAVAQVEIGTAFRYLPPRYVAILQLALGQGMNREQIKEALGLNEDQYRGLWYRASAAYERAVRSALDER